MIDKLKEYGSFIENYNLKESNTYKINTSCKYLVLPNNIEDLTKLMKYIKDNNLKYYVLGNASNVILPDDMFEGIIIKLDKLNKMSINENILTIEGGVLINTISNYLFNHNFIGFEWATGIPGTLGGSIIGNAGAYKECIFDELINVTILDEFNNVITLNKDEIEYNYRTTSLKGRNIIILESNFNIKKGDIEESKALVIDRKRRRFENQPLEYPSAGSVFRNPEGDYAGRLIEECGLKGYILGGAKISEKHANFIINCDFAKSSDIIELINLIKTNVKEKFNIDLILEQIIVKWD